MCEKEGERALFIPPTSQVDIAAQAHHCPVLTLHLVKALICQHFPNPLKIPLVFVLTSSCLYQHQSPGQWPGVLTFPLASVVWEEVGGGGWSLEGWGRVG